MPMDIAQPYPHSQARNFALRGLAWSLGLFGLMRLGWFESHAVLPVTLFQGRLAESVFGISKHPIDVTVACSGADAFALCAAAILAYPAIWPMRLAGVVGGTTLILVLNTARIGTLGRAAGAAAWFEMLHVYIWPALLMLAIAAYVFTWMRVADARGATRAASVGADRATPARVLTGRFAWSAAVLVVLFTAMSPWYLQSAAVLAAAAFVARAAAIALGVLGIQAEAAGNLLSTSRGAFLVTQECIATPLIPVYVAAVFTGVHTWGRRVPALLLAVPLFIALGVARLLVVALPVALIGSPLFLIHAFYQVLLAAVLVCLAALWRHGAAMTSARPALLGGALGVLAMYLAGPVYARVLPPAFAAAPLADPQGALALLPAFQAGLFVALSVAVLTVARWRPFAAGLAVLGLSQIVLGAALLFVARHGGFIPTVPAIRAWAVAAPVLVVLAIVAYERPPR